MRTVYWTRRRLLANSLISWFFPPTCALCLRVLWRPGESFCCEECAPTLEMIHPPFCSKCGRPFEGEEGRICGECIKDKPLFRYVRSPFRYATRLRHAVQRFKFYGETVRAASLTSLLLRTEGMGISWEDYDLVVPVPLHDDRLRQRGYNQALLLVHEVARHRKINWSCDALIRTRDTPPQIGLSAHQRRENLKGAFACPDPDEVEGMTILLVDDITTTGSTLAECAKTLHNAGAAVVDGATVSRVIVTD